MVRASCLPPGKWHLAESQRNYIPVDPSSAVGVRLSSFMKSSMISATAELRSSLARRLAIGTPLPSPLRADIQRIFGFFV